FSLVTFSRFLSGSSEHCKAGMLMTRQLNTLGRNCLVLILAAYSSHAAGLEYELSVGYLGEYTDNARRTGDEETSDIIHHPYVTAGIEHLAPRLELGADYRLQRRS